MNEDELRNQWDKDKPIFQAWGDFVADEISKTLVNEGKCLSSFLKVPASVRLKDDNSLVEKALYRPNKRYSDPYNEIEDKVGVRFIVLLLSDIKDICAAIEKSEFWSLDPCKHFDNDKENNPLLFTYQSVHYILKPVKVISVNDIEIAKSTSCEVQIRTLLQHAHAELTHDAIYKAKRAIKPKVHRTVAKSMALIETTDDFFTEVTHLLNHGPLEEFKILDRLDGLFYSYTGIKPHTQKSGITIWDEFESLIDCELVDNIQNEFCKEGFSHLSGIIKDRYKTHYFYQQSTILFIYWMLKKKKRILLERWPLHRNLLIPLANDLGVSILE
jgi:ppGpp synthetase/RelA/SpoT-type nucleotidyltranferase